MFVICRTCGSSYHIPDEILGEGPRQFRCSQCSSSWELRGRATLTASVASTRGAPARFERPPAAPALRFERLRSVARSLAAPLAAAGLIAASMTAIGARGAIVAAAPLTAGAYAAIGLPVNPRGLAIEDVHARLEDSGGKMTLIVEGVIANLRQGETAMPALRIALRAADGRELYVWSTRAPKDRLASRERTSFAARLAAPPEGVRDALVKFVAPGDKVALNPEGS
jgi:predicted Zn finger-like uncharacterized protein